METVYATIFKPLVALLLTVPVLGLYGLTTVFGDPASQTLGLGDGVFAVRNTIWKSGTETARAGELTGDGKGGSLTPYSALIAKLRASAAKARFNQLGKRTKFGMSSITFSNKGDIPIAQSCWVQGLEEPGEGMSPAISWVNVPRSATHLALLVHDPDADFIHWFILISKRSSYWKTGLSVDVPDEDLKDIKGIYQEPNDFGVAGYSGPCPPAGERHRYTFELYAVRGAKEGDYGQTAEQIRKKLRKIQLNKSVITGYFSGIGEAAPTHAPTPHPSLTPISTRAPTPTATPISTLTPTPTILSGVAAVSSGSLHSCGLLNSGGVKCWGDDYFGQVGSGGEFTPVWRPSFVFGLTMGVIKISAGAWHTCALLSSGAVKCWGRNFFGQLGDGTDQLRLTPVSVLGLAGSVSEVSAGGSHTCARLGSGALMCWGKNWEGQLGIGAAGGDTSTPQAVVGLSSGVTQVSAGGAHTCALLSSGGVKCWGFNYFGQVGDGTKSSIWESEDKNTPTQVLELSFGVVQISAGSAHTCALLSSGGVKCWGANSDGQVGDGTWGAWKTAPTNVTGLSSGVSQIAAGGTSTCALLNSGGLKCWGNGPVGDGTLADRNTPTSVAGLSAGVTQISVGGEHMCARLASGYAKCWGLGNSGQLGNGRGADGGYEENPGYVVD